MGISIEILLTNLFGLFALIGVGYLIPRLKIASADLTGPLSAILLNVTLPATIFHSMLRPFDSSFVFDSLMICLLGAVCFVGTMLLAFPASRLFRVPQARRGIWMMASVYPNVGFMGFPLILALLGEDGLLLAVILCMVQNLFVYSLGIKQIVYGLPRDREGAAPTSFKKLMLTMINFSAVLGILFFCLQIPVPEIIEKPIALLDGVSTPLSMLVIGMNIAKAPIREALRDRDVYTATLTRLAVFPLLVWAGLKLLPGSWNPMIAKVVLIVFAMPTASVAGVLAERYRSDAALGARISFLTSLLCIASIPLICLLP